MKTFSNPQDKAQYFVNRYTPVIYNAVLADVNKVAKATGNKESKESLKLSAQAALWITVCEYPKESPKGTLKRAKDLFSSWVRNEYNDEILRNRTRKNSPHNYKAMPWGGSTKFFGEYIDPRESPDQLVEREFELKHLVKIVDQLILEWGPHSTVWAIANFRNSKGVLDTARKLGFSEQELKDKKIKNKLRKIYRVLAEIELEMGQNAE